MKSFFFGRKIGQRKTGVGLDDADSGEEGKIEAFGDGLSADDDVIIAVFYLFEFRIQSFCFGVVGVKTSDFGMRKKFLELGFEELGAEAFVNDTGVFAIWTRGWNFRAKTASVTDEAKRIRVEGKRKKTGRTEGLPAAFFTDSKRGGATAVVENESLMVIFEVFFDIL